VKSRSATFFRAELLIVLAMLAVPASAQTFTVLTNFNGTNGSYPRAPLTVVGGTLYGTTEYGGNSFTSGSIASGWGTVFKINTDGTGFATLRYFTGNDGYDVRAGVTIDNSTLYGAASQGGISGYGVLFRSDTNGFSASNIKNFDPEYSGVGSPYPTNYTGVNPSATLVLSGSTLYGTASGCGASNSGTLFKVDTNGSNFTVLRNFSSGEGFPAYPGLLLLGNTLYGALNVNGALGGTNSGLIFKINTDGTGYSVLRYMPLAVNDPSLGASTNFEGAGGPFLMLSGSNFYGTCGGGGRLGGGTIFKMDTNGSNFTVLKNFSNPSNYIIQIYTNNDGSAPSGRLTLVGNVLYGTASHGGMGGNGTIFQINTDGSGFTVLKTFSALLNNIPNTQTLTNSDGANPTAGLVQSGGTLYGTAFAGGIGGGGTLFAMPIPLAITSSTTTSGVTNQQFSFALSGPLGSNVVISTSTNFQTWQPLLTNALTGGSLNFTDAVPVGTVGRYYRASFQ
jgi:uncharacterized repeat protein (TIGR03803 family)